MSGLLTTREVAEMLGLSSATVLRRWRAGELPGYRLSSNVLRFDRAAIDAYLRGCLVGADEETPSREPRGVHPDGLVLHLPGSTVEEGDDHAS